MKTLTNKTLVLAVAMTLCATPSMAATELSVQPLSQSEKHTTSATVATSPASFHALSGLDAETLAAQEMTDQELKTVEGAEMILMWRTSLGSIVIDTTTSPVVVDSLSSTYTCGSGLCKY